MGCDSNSHAEWRARPHPELPLLDARQGSRAPLHCRVCMLLCAVPVALRPVIRAILMRDVALLRTLWNDDVAATARALGPQRLGHPLLYVLASVPSPALQLPMYRV